MFFFSCTQGYAETQAPGDTAQVGKVKTLTGFVEHKEELPPLDPSFQPGRTLDKSKLPKFASNQFYSIPYWLAGSWHHDKQVTYYTLDYATKSEDRQIYQDTARGDEEIGWQQDARGGIWQYGNAPYTAIVRSEGRYVVQITKAIEPLSSSQTQLVVRFSGVDLLVDEASNQIVSAEQTDKLQVYTRCPEYGPRYNKCVGSVKTFDKDGKPIRLAQVVTIGVRTGPFVATDTYNGRDIKLLFEQYLLSRGLKSLIPSLQPRPKPAVGLRAQQGRLTPGASKAASTKRR